jgi:DNA-binding LacI/PurR family transcriptional regulator
MEKRPTMRDIAKLVNMSGVAVSLALRKHPSIPQKTRERIEEVARQIGYRPDPALSALMVYRRGAKPVGYQGIMALLNTHEQPEYTWSGPPYSLYLKGAQDRCAKLGYQLEEFRLKDLDWNFKRLSKILCSRNIQGVIVPPQQHPHAHISTVNFDWKSFSAVAIGFSLVSPKLHVIMNAQHRSARLAVGKLRSLGYRRIACISDETLNMRTDSNFLGGYLVEQDRFPAACQVPLFRVNSPTLDPSKDGECMQECRKWYSAHKPDAILDLSLHACYSRELQRTTQAKFGIASIDHHEAVDEIAGIDQNSLLVGRVAVDEVVAQILTNQRGVPAIPKNILIEGTWIDGVSAPRVTRTGQEKIEKEWSIG